MSDKNGPGHSAGSTEPKSLYQKEETMSSRYFCTHIRFSRNILLELKKSMKMKEICLTGGLFKDCLEMVTVNVYVTSGMFHIFCYISFLICTVCVIHSANKVKLQIFLSRSILVWVIFLVARPLKPLMLSGQFYRNFFLSLKKSYFS